MARFATAEHEATDTNAGYQGTATVPIGRLRLRFALEGEARGGHAALGLARIVEMRADKSVVLDDGLHPAAAGQPRLRRALAGFVTQLQGLLHHRAEALAGRVSETATRGAAEIADYLLLQVCNRYEPLMTHLAATLGQMHPEDFYRLAVSLAGELATFTESAQASRDVSGVSPRRPAGDVPPGDGGAAPVAVGGAGADGGADPAAGAPFGIRVGPIADRSLLSNATWVLAVKAQMPAEALRRGFPNLVKIGPVEQIRELINVALPGDRRARPAGGAAPAPLLRRTQRISSWIAAAPTGRRWPDRAG